MASNTKWLLGKKPCLETYTRLNPPRPYRAVQFIREQASRTNAPEDPISVKKAKNVASRAAGKAIRKLMVGDPGQDKTTAAPRANHQTGDIQESDHDPKDGWGDDVAVRHGHFMLLLKPQVALRSERDSGSDVVAVGEATLFRSFFSI